MVVYDPEVHVGIHDVVLMELNLPFDHEMRGVCNDKVDKAECRRADECDPGRTRNKVSKGSRLRASR
jgi:hypothetical protein